MRARAARKGGFFVGLARHDSGKIAKTVSKRNQTLDRPYINHDPKYAITCYLLFRSIGVNSCPAHIGIEPISGIGRVAGGDKHDDDRSDAEEWS